MTRKTKSLHSITIDGCLFQTQLEYNISTNHIYIGTSYHKHQKSYTKQYYINNKEKIKINTKQYREDNKNKYKKYNIKYYESYRNPNTNRKGSLEDRIMRSCGHQGINRSEWNGFLTDQKYCSLFNESFKELIRNRFHNKCYLCGTTTKRKLSVHHVNYDKNCLCGSSCEFVPLCHNCHSKTNGNRQYWEDLIMCYLYPNRYFIVEF